jgi:hypothetical protein
MRIKTPSLIKHLNYNKSTLCFITGFTFSLMSFQLSAGETTVGDTTAGETTPAGTGAGTQSKGGNGSTKKGSDFLKGSGMPTGPGYINNGGIIKDTDFSRETGASRQIEGGLPPGFSNKIIFTTGVAHDSNPALDDTNKKSTWIYSFIPQVLLNYIGEVNSLYLDAALLIQRHSNEEILTDREDPRLAIGWDRTYESGLFGLYANYFEASSRGEEIRAGGVFTGNGNGDDNTQRVKAYGAKWEHSFAPRLSLLTNGEYSERVFSGGGANLIDFSTVGVRSKLNYEYTERLDTYLQAGFVQVRPDQTFRDTDLARLAFGADYQVSEALRVSSRAGPYHLSGRQSDSGWEAGIQVRYDVGRMGFVAEANRELGVSSVAAFQKADTYRLGWLFDISERDKLNVNYTLVKFKEDSQANLEESDTQEISAFYDRIIGGNWRGQANVSFREQDRTGGRNDGNIVGVALIYDGLSF